MNIGKMMKDLKKMQAKMEEEIDSIEVEGTAGGGMVQARMNGKRELLGLKIQPDAVDPDDLTLLEDLVLAAVNDAGRKVDERVKDATQGLAGLTGGMKIPGL